MCDGLQCELSEGKGSMLLFPTSPLKHIPVSLVLLLIPELGLEGRAGEQRGLFYPKSALLTPTISVSISARGVILAAAAP